MIGIFTSRNQAHEITCFWTPYMVSQMLQSSTTCTFIVNNLYICQKRCIYIRRYIIVFNNTHFKKNIFLQLQPKIISFNNICWTSTKISFIQQQYSFNLNQNCFHSTKIFVQLQPKLISFNNNVCSTSTKIIFIQQQRLFNFNQNHFHSRINTNYWMRFTLRAESPVNDLHRKEDWRNRVLSHLSMRGGC